jgi:hypothetical protein
LEIYTPPNLALKSYKSIKGLTVSSAQANPRLRTLDLEWLELILPQAKGLWGLHPDYADNTLIDILTPYLEEKPTPLWISQDYKSFAVGLLPMLADPTDNYKDLAELKAYHPPTSVKRAIVALIEAGVSIVHLTATISPNGEGKISSSILGPYRVSSVVLLTIIDKSKVALTTPLLCGKSIFIATSEAKEAFHMVRVANWGAVDALVDEQVVEVMEPNAKRGAHGI